MLPLDECRRILGPDCDLSDRDLERLRGQLCDLAAVTIAVLEEQRQAGPAMEGSEAKLEMIPEDDRDEVEERAAIVEFQGGMSRPEAERLAVQQYFEETRP